MKKCSSQTSSLMPSVLYTLFFDKTKNQLSIIPYNKSNLGKVDRQIVHYGNYDPSMEFDIQIKRNCAFPAMGFTTLHIQGN
ncbi:hypothetical protein OH492_28630 [Vibrio chagasii]|nr:hypothetical protein [Vibrio chagasii]